jgi:hypothetical protein
LIFFRGYRDLLDRVIVVSLATLMSDGPAAGPARVVQHQLSSPTVFIFPVSMEVLNPVRRGLLAGILLRTFLLVFEQSALFDGRKT